ncbi:hypothetical protein, partial [Pararhodospirillum oryzae]|uniref:hypothetical protein n=1 Tax=Pararhodospirillum oryzae TaxID=478448 RepID=UPI001C3FE982
VGRAWARARYGAGHADAAERQGRADDRAVLTGGAAPALPPPPPPPVVAVWAGHAEAVGLFLVAQREWVISDYSGLLLRLDWGTAMAVWEGRGWPVRSGRMAATLAQVQALADAAQAEANTLMLARQRQRQGSHHGR